MANYGPLIMAAAALGLVCWFINVAALDARRQAADLDRWRALNGEPVTDDHAARRRAGDHVRSHDHA